jgi:hypothetical protein
MSSRSAAATVVVTDAFQEEVRRLRLRLTREGKPRKPGDDQRNTLSQSRLASLLDMSDGSAIARLESGDTKAIRRETVELLAGTLEQERDRGKLCAAAKILPVAAEAALSMYRRAAGRGLPMTVDVVRRIEAGMLAEDAYAAAGVSIADGPVPEDVLLAVAKINPRYLSPRHLRPDTPLIRFTETRVPARRAPGVVDVEIGWRDSELRSSAITQFIVAHAAGHRLLQHGTCQYPQMDVWEQMANDVGVRLLAPSATVQATHARAVAALGRGDEDADLWAIGVAGADGRGLPAWVVVALRVATELNVPGWLAIRRLAEERLMDAPTLTEPFQ